MDFINKIKRLVIRSNLIKHTFAIEGFVYVDTCQNPVHYISENVRWLGLICVHCRYKDIDKKAIEKFEDMYPQYRGYINVF